MSLTLNLGEFGSRAARVASVGKDGLRRIAVNATTTHQEEGNPITSVYNAIERFGQSLIRLTVNALGSALRFSWSKLWGMATREALYLINFNWNITDTQLDEQIKQAEIGIAAAKGTLAGTSLGYAICGFIPSATVAVFNEPLALYMMQELGEEAAEDISAALSNLISLQIRAQAQRGFAALFKNYRTLFRGAAIGFAQRLANIGILSQDSVNKANKNRNQPWSIAGALTDSIESIKDPATQAYFEEFWDEFQDSCIEAGFVIANAADSYFAQQKMANKGMLGEYGVVTIEPVRNADEEDGNTINTTATPTP